MNWLKRLFGKKQEPKKEQKRTYSNGVSGAKITHWMELPTPPTQEN